MATKNKKDNTYYSLTKFFHFSSWILLLIPIVELILGVLPPDKVTVPEIAYQVIAIIAFILIIVWTIFNIIMFVFAGNLRGLKSPLGIRFGLLISLAFVFAGAILSIVSSYVPSVAEALEPKWWAVIITILQILGLIIAAYLARKIKKALR